MPLALDHWHVATSFDHQATYFGILLVQIGHQSPRIHFSIKKQLKYFQILISGGIYDFCFGPPLFDLDQLKLSVIGPGGPPTFET